MEGFPLIVTFMVDSNEPPHLTDASKPTNLQV